MNRRRLWTDGVTDVAHGVDERRIADFFSKPSNEYLDQFRVVFVGMLPDSLAKFRASEDPAGLAHEHLEQHQFARRKLDASRAAINVAGGQVQREIADAQGESGFFRVAAAEGAHASEQFLHGKGF